MISSTRRAIMDSLLKLLDERPLSRISVKDIVVECGISRNTFYYHFQDLPDLIEAMVREEVDRIMQQYVDIRSLEQCLEAAMRIAGEHRQAIYHIYNSANRDIYERYLMKICEYVVSRFVDHLTMEKPVRSEDKEIIVRDYKCECFGHIVDWLNNGMSHDLEKQFLRLCELRRGQTEEMLERSRKQ